MKTHYKGLDVLRALAVFLVIIWHWESKSFFLNQINIGEIGVNVFFVLSGYLITGILLKLKNSSEKNIWNHFKIFYIRRTLRIFPVYYITILFFSFLIVRYHHNEVGKLLYLYTYTANYYFYFHQGWDGMISHLWSLAVEEQFYLFWPFAILLVNNRYISIILWIAILVGLISRIYFSFFNLSLVYPHLTNILIPTVLDTFGIGGLLAYKESINFDFKKYFTKWTIVLIIGVCLMLLFFSKADENFILNRTCISVLSILLIVFLKKEVLSKYLEKAGFLVYSGKISYGLYLYHNFIGLFNNSLLIKFKWLNILCQQYQLLFFVIDLCLLYVIASLSYFVIELPFLRLKNRFDY